MSARVRESAASDKSARFSLMLRKHSSRISSDQRADDTGVRDAYQEVAELSRIQDARVVDDDECH